MALTQKSASIYNLLKEVEGNSLSLSQVAQMTGMSIQEVKAEVKRLVYKGGDVCYHKGIVFLATKKEFPIYTILVGVLFSGFAYLMVNHFVNWLLG